MKTQETLQSNLWSDLAHAASGGLVEAVQAAASAYTVGAVLIAWALTHYGKVYLEAYHQPLTRSPAKWRWCVTTMSIALSAISAACWALVSGQYASIPVIAILAPFAWRAAVLVPGPQRRFLTTATDRRFMGMGE